MRRIWADLLLQEFDSYDMPGELGKIAVANTTYGVSAPSEGAYQDMAQPSQEATYQEIGLSEQPVYGDDFPEPSYEYEYEAEGMFEPAATTAEEPEAQPGDFQFEDFDVAEW